jgi:hypothetical protein
MKEGDKVTITHGGGGTTNGTVQSIDDPEGYVAVVDENGEEWNVSKERVEPR